MVFKHSITLTPEQAAELIKAGLKAVPPDAAVSFDVKTRYSGYGMSESGVEVLDSITVTWTGDQ